MARLLYRIGRACARRAWLSLTTWVVALVAVIIIFLVAGGTLTSTFSIPGTPTEEVTDRLASELPDAAGGSGTVVFHTTDDSEITQEQRTAISEAVDETRDISGVSNVVDPFEAQTQRQEQLAELEDGQSELDDARAELEEGREQLEDGREQVEEGQAELDEAREQLADSGAPESAQAELEQQQEQLDQSREELEEQEAQLEEGQAELESNQTQLDQGRELAELSEEIRTVSEDGSAAIANVVFTQSQFDILPETREQVLETLTQTPIEGVEADATSDIAQGVPEIFGVGEAVGLGVAAVTLIVMLGTLIGAGLPILNALIGVVIGVVGALSLSGVVDMAAITPVLGLMLGLAVGIDYSLFIVNRHRRQLKAGSDLQESISLANGTSGNAVVFAGSTVIIALLALNVTGIPFLGLMGTVGAACVLTAVLVATTLTPALLGLMGMRILSRRERASLADRQTPEAAAADPVLVGVPEPMSTPSALARVLIGVVALGVIALPAMDLRLNLPDGSSESSDSTQYQAYTTISEKFGEGLNGPLLVVADLPQTGSETELTGEQLGAARALSDRQNVMAVAPIGTSDDDTVTAFQVVPAGGPTSESTEALVSELRASSPLADTYPIGVAGSASGNIDISNILSEALPGYLAVVIGLSLIILVVVFRSLYVPVIATLGFVLSYFAALGGVVAIYQWGWLGPLFGVENPGPILNFLPTLLVGILFGLAMDYMLFLGTGMREAYVHGTPARAAVVQGFRGGRTVVTAAAIIMISVFGGFMFSDSAMIRPIGFALAFGVLVDAFVVRMTIIPALMHLAGDKAWWLPKWLNRILPSVEVEGADLERPQRPQHGTGK